MTRPIAVLRPEPGNRVTAAAIEARGRRTLRMPLFTLRALPWRAPPAERFDALLLTSANAVRHGGPRLADYAALPVHAVGEATAAAARRAGFEVAAVGSGGSRELIAAAARMGVARALHLGGRDRLVEAGGIVATAVAVYASECVVLDREALQSLAGTVALVQSPRAGARLAELVEMAAIDRSGIAVAAVSQTAARAAGTGWQQVRVAPRPNTELLIDAALALAD